jgi:hypothetical protein
MDRLSIGKFYLRAHAFCVNVVQHGKPAPGASDTGMVVMGLVIRHPWYERV